MKGQAKKSAGTEPKVTVAAKPRVGPVLEPVIALSAYLESSVGSGPSGGTLPVGGYLRVTLCGFGPVLPAIPGNSMMADAGVPQLIGPQVGSAALTVGIFPNDIIVPAGTFYEIAVLDATKNVINAANYQFSSSDTSPKDLSELTPTTQPYGFPLQALKYVNLVATADPTVWTPVGALLAVTYNGIILPQNDATHLSWSLVGGQVKLSFTPGPTDLIASFAILSYSPA